MKSPKSISVAPFIIEKYGKDKIVYCLEYLSTQFPDEVLTKFLPKELNSLVSFLWLENIAENLKKFSSHDGFSDFLREFKSDIQSHVFTLNVASFLHRKCDAITFEPKIAATGRKADLLIQFEQKTIVLECKSPISIPKPDLKKHEQLNLMARQTLPQNYSAHFLYRENKDISDFEEVFVRVAKLLPAVTNGGTIFENSWISVRADSVLEGQLQNVEIRLDMAMFGERADECFPGHAFYQSGYTVGFYGPLINLSNLILKKLKRSARQADPNYSFITVINSSHFHGNSQQNIAGVRKEFTPKINKRIGGAWLFASSIKDEAIHFESQFVSNPFAEKPLPTNLITFIRSSQR